MSTGCCWGNQAYSVLALSLFAFDSAPSVKHPLHRLQKCNCDIAARQPPHCAAPQLRCSLPLEWCWCELCDMNRSNLRYHCCQTKTAGQSSSTRASCQTEDLLTAAAPQPAATCGLKQHNHHFPWLDAALDSHAAAPSPASLA